MPTLLLLIAALVCFGLAVFNVSLGAVKNLVALGLVFWVLTLIIPFL